MNWRLAAAYGVMWGLAVSTMETFEVPLAFLSATDLAMLLTSFVAQFCLSGVMLASATMLLDRRISLPLAALALLTFALLVRALMQTLRPLFPLPSSLNGGSGLHIYWISMFYGGLFVAAWHLSVQAERTRGRLVQAEIARQRTEASLGAARFQSLQGHVDPAFLLRAMVAMQGRYGRDPRGMDRLLDPLVAFLRAAMPGVRSGASTLAEEVALATKYARVCSELDPSRPMLAVRLEGPLPQLPFPALTLLPLLDHLAAAAPAQQARLRVHCVGARCTLALALDTGTAAAGWLARDWLYRFQVELRTLFGNDWTLALGDGHRHPALLLTLPLPLRQPIVLPSPTPLEVSHG